MTLNVSVLINADASGAQKGFKVAREEMGQTGEAARRLGADSKTAASGIDEAAEASRRAAAAAKEQAQAEKAAAAEQQRNIRAIIEAREALSGYAAARAQLTQMTLNARLGVRDEFGAAERARDIEAYGRAVEELRGRYVPLYAIEQKRRQLIDEISAAERAGALSSGEAADAIDRVTVSMNGQADAARALRAAIAETIAQQEAAAQRALPNSSFQVNQRLGVRDDFGSADREADIVAAFGGGDDLRAKWDPAFAQQRVYVANLEEIREAHRLGVLSADQMTAAVKREEAAYANRVREQAVVAGGGLPAYRRANLFSQYLDIGTSVAGGMNPALIAAQQGPQIVEAYGGVKPTLDAIRGSLTATRGVIGGVTGALLVGALAWDDYSARAKRAAAAAAGVGRGAGVTPRDLRLMAEQEGPAAGLGVAQTEELQATMLRAGLVGRESFQGVIRLAKDFAATIGTEVEPAAEELSKTLADPGAGAQRLLQMRLLSAAEAAHAQKLAEQNRTEEARRSILRDLPGHLASAKEAVTTFGQIGEFAGRQWGDFWRNVGKGADVIAGMRRNPVANPRVRAGAQRDAAAAEAADAERVERERRERENGAIVERARSTLNRSPSIELERRRAELRQEIADLEARQRSGASYSTNGEEDATKRRQEAAAIEAKRNALAGLLPESQRQAELDRIELQLLTARDPIARATLEQDRARALAKGEEISSTEAAARANNAYARSLGESLAASSTSLTDMREETAARAAVNDAIAAGHAPLSALEDLVRQQLQLKPLLIAYDKAEGAAKAELAAIIGGLRNAYAAEAQERARSSALQSIRGQSDQLERLKVELGLVTATNAARERELALLETNQRIREIFGSADSNDPLAQRMRDNAVAIADMRAELERSKAAYDDIRQVGGRAIDEVTRKIADGTGGWKELVAGVLGDVKQQLATWAIANPLKNQIFGENLPTMQDAGGVLGRLFGGKGASAAETAGAAALSRSTQLMTVSATTVVVNGGVQGGGAGLAAVGSPGVIGGGVPSFSSATTFQGGYADMIRASAARHGIDPETALRVAKAEGGTSGWVQAGYVKNGYREPSYGPFQALVGGKGTGFPTGQGNAMLAQGIDPRDPSNAQAVIDWQMRYASQNGWGEWYGAPKAGVGKWDGINRGAAAAPPVQPAPAELQRTSFESANRSVDAFAASTQKADLGIAGFGTSMDQTAKTVAAGATGVGGSAQQLAGATAQIPAQTQGFFSTALGALGQGLDGIVRALSGVGGGGGGGGGLGGFFSSLFGGGGGAAPAPASAAAMTMRAAGPVTASAIAPPRPANDRGGGSASGGFGATTIRIVNSGKPAQVESARERQSADGGREIEAVLAEMVADDIATSGSATQKAMGSTFGLGRVAKVRGG